MKMRIFLGLFLFSHLPLHSASSDLEQVREILIENMLPFWSDRVVEEGEAGYRLHFDREGRYLGSAPKGIVSQARTVWFYSRLLRSGLGDDRSRRLADHGFQFLRDSLWDQDFGGFFWTVDARGERALRSDKHLYGQAFGLYALSEYTRATGNTEALKMARRLFGLLEEHAHDARFGGYHESFRRDWSPIEDDSLSPMSLPSSLKLMNTHLHLMEAFTSYVEVTREKPARERLVELITILGNSVVRKSVGACTDQYLRDWTPAVPLHRDRVSYGHDLENVWLLMEAAAAADFHDGPLLDLYRTLVDYSLRYGFDSDDGGVYYWGPVRSKATNQVKSWWVQAEALVCFLKMYRRTGHPRYQALFRKTLGWIYERQVDWEKGGWFSTVDVDGERTGNKASLWKTPYHSGRAMIIALELLQGEDPETR